MHMQNESYIAIGASLIAVFAWSAVFARVLSKDDRRRSSLMMPLAALLASIGTLASALGMAQQIGTIDFSISPQALTLVASMGRGALAAAGLIVFTEHEIFYGRKQR